MMLLPGAIADYGWQMVDPRSAGHIAVLCDQAGRRATARDLTKG
jgi:hypothetical protein